jgi:branched-chain amino acid transport system substrate-binding protein
MRIEIALVSLLLALPVATHAAIPSDKITIGILQDLPEPYASETGDGALVAAQLAVDDFETKHFAADGEVLSGNSTGGLKADLDQARDWLEKEHVDAIVSSASARVNQALAKMLQQHHRTLLIAAAAAGSAKVCGPNVIVWGPGEDARMRALVKVFSAQNKRNWYFVGALNPPGLSSLVALKSALNGQQAKLVGATQYPVGALNFGQAIQAIDQTNADVAVIAESDSDLIDALRGLVLNRPTHSVAFAAPYAQTIDIDEAGPRASAGLVVPAPFYWDTNKTTRAFSREWSNQMRYRHVTENAAEVYAATASFLNAAVAAHDVDAQKVGAALRRTPIPDSLLGPATIRADGRVVYDLNVYRVKSPGTIQHRWAYYDKIATVPGSQVFLPGDCSMPSAKTAENSK